MISSLEPKGGAPLVVLSFAQQRASFMMMMSIALPLKFASVHPVLIITLIRYTVQLRHLMPQALSIKLFGQLHGVCRCPLVQSPNQFDK